MSLSNIHINRLNGSKLDWSTFAGKRLLFVNVASECGFTPQYAQLQELYSYHKDKLEIIALPCNDFGAQEPGSAKDIESFCQVDYGVEFTVTEKIGIINEPHELIKFLCETESEPFIIDWNFNKIMLDENDHVLGRFRSSVNPLDEQILNLIAV